MTEPENIAGAVSDAELDILQQLWLQSPLSAQDLIEKLDGHPSTIKTLINRLLNKGALTFEERQRKYFYYPTVGKEEFYRLKTDSFLDRFFDGEVSPLLSFFSSQRKLSAKDIAELKALIAQHEQEESDDER